MGAKEEQDENGKRHLNPGRDGILFRLGGVDFHAMVEYARAHPDQFTRDPNFQVLDIEEGVVRISGFFDLVKEGQRRGELDKDCHYLRFEGVDVERGICFLNNTRVYQADGTNAWDLTRADLEARKQMRLLLGFIRRFVPGCRDAFLLETATNLGVRETRRIRGAYIFDETDILSGQTFEDRVVQMYSHVVMPGQEVHSPDRGEGSPEDAESRDVLHQEHSFFLPYRALVPQGANGLLVAGRAISQTHAADKWTRGMPCCIQMGQAAGTAAALACQSGTAPRCADVRILQRMLGEQGIDLSGEPARSG